MQMGRFLNWFSTAFVSVHYMTKQKGERWRSQCGHVIRAHDWKFGDPIIKYKSDHQLNFSLKSPHGRWSIKNYSIGIKIDQSQMPPPPLLVTSERKAKFDWCEETEENHIQRFCYAHIKRPEKCQFNFYPPMQAFEDKAVCSRISHSWHVGDTSTLYNPGVIMTSYTVQFTLPLTHAHSTQDPFNQVSKFFRNFPLTSRHTGSNNRSHTTELFEVQVHFFFGSSNQTSPDFLVFLWLSMQVKPIGGGRTTNIHCTCIGPLHERVKKTPPFHTLISRVFLWANAFWR